MTVELFLQTVVNATYAASYMALIAVGFVLIFGVMGVVNFAHGELYMAGATWLLHSMPIKPSRSLLPSPPGWFLSGCSDFSWSSPCSGHCGTIHWGV